jgi:hypothetical protein
MKKRYIALLVALGFLLVWLGSMGVAGILTALYADEFTDFEAMDLQWLSGESYERRVLSYGQQHAKVYFYNESLGACIRFVKQDGQWKTEKEVATWSSQGSADDYFIWPYYKHYVP